MLTNEERRVDAYATHKRPTVANEVVPQTPLEALNLNWRESDLPERERTKHVHRLHPYLGKFIPQLVEVFLRKYFKMGDTVADPFCGSGTTLVQANELGINAVGYDVSAFNVLLSRVKTARFDLLQVQSEVHDILQKVRQVAGAHSPQRALWMQDNHGEPCFETEDAYLRQWFAPQALQELLAYRHFAETGAYTYRDLLKVILSRSARSARLTRHFDLDFPKAPQTEPYWCYKHRRVCSPTKEALKFLERYSADTVRRIKDFAAKRTDASVEVYHADSRSAPFPHVNGIITSPPYVGLIDYHAQHAYAYHLLGLEDRCTDEIGSATNGCGSQACQRYVEDVAAVLRRAMACVVNGGPIIVVAADRRDLYNQIAEAIGAEVEGVVKRHVNRRTGMRANEFYESIFVWRKPGE